MNCKDLYILNYKIQYKTYLPFYFICLNLKIKQSFNEGKKTEIMTITCRYMVENAEYKQVGDQFPQRKKRRSSQQKRLWLAIVFCFALLVGASVAAERCHAYCWGSQFLGFCFFHFHFNGFNVQLAFCRTFDSREMYVTLFQT